MKKNNFYLLLLTAIVLSSCNSNTKSSGKSLQKITLRQEWFPNANYAGELIAMYETDSVNGIDLTVVAGSDNIDPIKLVLSGENDFGVVSSDRILTANENGADLVVIGVANINSPTCYLSKEEKNIKTPKDFENHTVGILTGTNTELIYKILKKKANVNSKLVKEVEAPFDLATFISGAYDVRPAFVYDEPVSLEQQNVKFNMIKPEDYGVKFLGTVYFTKRTTVEQKPELVQAFINSLAQGWTKAFSNPNLGITYLKKYDKDIDVNRETKSLEKAIPYFKGESGKVLTCDMNRWEEMSNSLIEIGTIKSVDLKKLVNNTFVNKYHSGK